MHPLINVVQPVVVEPFGLTVIIDESLKVLSPRGIQTLADFEYTLHIIANMDSVTPAEKLAAQILLSAVSASINKHLNG